MTPSTPTAIQPPTDAQIQAVKIYIKKNWQTLSRSLSHILEAAQDPKLEHDVSQPWRVYISPREDIAAVRQSIRQAVGPAEFEQIELRILPPEASQIKEHGLLYLPYDYVVPGGRFNEMYGWDSYFIMLGLLHDGEVGLAQSMVDQLVYEIDHYGTVLNANRTYMLNRSQPPILTRMVLRLFEVTQDKTWLQSILPSVEHYYFYWVVPPHLNQITGLSHYNALGNGPAPEVVASERDEAGRTHYDRVREYYREHEITDYDVSLYYDREADRLTELFYQGDRSMRESGFDITNRFGPFSADIIHCAPVCLNVLLYQMETDIAQIQNILGHREAIAYWQQQSETRHQLIDQFLWDEPTGLYFDYNFRTGQRRPYEFVTTFFPLWAGIASEAQAQRTVENLAKFEAPGGLLTSTYVSGNQWDAPFGWAPLQLFAIEGLQRYGYTTEAQRVASKFINMVIQEFEKSGTLVEKYDVVRCSAQVSDEIHFGYSSNEIGFGWTNGVLLELLEHYC
ncbi:MAG: alpha,alpha-trehalase [Leptolyngbyaceae cyanobacterium SL_1_1]|nr:alpha,alpha-trehalase [Leptolyngbyaceae cyanobacterium RM1_1_2]NJO08430.1 alpha,alpha-trehalase [Leptolyngbyaceae cyanobacterium SL_1_1]